MVQAELFGGAATGVNSPQIDGQMTGHGDDRFLAPAPGARAPLARTARRFLTGGYCGWKRTMRQAHSTSAARNRGLPCLVTLPGYPFAAAAVFART